MMDAIMYARKHLAAWGSTNMKELQQAMATLAFKSNTDCAGYKVGVMFYFSRPPGITTMVSVEKNGVSYRTWNFLTF